MSSFIGRVRFPVWLIAKGPPNNQRMVFIGNAKEKPLWPIFTSRDNAERFIKEASLIDAEPFAADRAALLVGAQNVQSRDTELFAIDPTLSEDIGAESLTSLFTWLESSE